MAYANNIQKLDEPFDLFWDAPVTLLTPGRAHAVESSSHTLLQKGQLGEDLSSFDSLYPQ